jgi:hypothetical protein
MLGGIGLELASVNVVKFEGALLCQQEHLERGNMFLDL